MNTFEKFYSLHHQSKAFLLGNVWNVNSARIYQDNGIEALGTSSYAIADSLGYPDGGVIPFAELVYIVNRIIKSISIPLSVDIEAGHGESAEEIVSNIESLVDLGVVGINIEDSINRQLKPENSFFEILSKISDGLTKRNIRVFINVRVDPFLFNSLNPVEETISRITLYQQCDIHGIFVPGILNAEEIKKIVSIAKLPLNLLMSPGLPPMEILSDLGVKRVSLGANAYRAIYHDLNEKTLKLFK